VQIAVQYFRSAQKQNGISDPGRYTELSAIQKNSQRIDPGRHTKLEIGQQEQKIAIMTGWAYILRMALESVLCLVDVKIIHVAVVIVNKQEKARRKTGFFLFPP